MTSWPGATAAPTSGRASPRSSTSGRRSGSADDQGRRRSGSRAGRSMTAPAERRVLENLRNLDGARQVWTAEVAGRAGLAATVPGWWSRRRGRADGGTQWGCRPAAGDGARQARTRLARFRQLAGTAGLEITAAGRDDLREPGDLREHGAHRHRSVLAHPARATALPRGPGRCGDRASLRPSTWPESRGEYLPQRCSACARRPREPPDDGLHRFGAVMPGPLTQSVGPEGFAHDRSRPSGSPRRDFCRRHGHRSHPTCT